MLCHVDLGNPIANKHPGLDKSTRKPSTRYKRHLKKRNRRTHPADNVIIVGEMGFAVLAPKDLIGVEVYVVCETHDGC